MEPLSPASLAPVATLLQPSDVEPVDGVTPVEPDDETGPDGKARGVIRLLEAGHFRGVADVRLRINFFEELSARAGAAAGPVVEEHSHELTDTVAARVDELLNPLATDETFLAAIGSAVDEFRGEVESAVGDAESKASWDGETLTSAIQAAFEEMISHMRELFTAPAADAPPPANSTNDDRTIKESSTLPVIDPISVAPMDAAVTDVSDPATEVPAPDPAVALDDAIESLRTAFTEALRQLMDAIDSATRLPDPSAPRNGNGSAYDKFLAIYNDLRGVSSAIDQTV